jgi:hypothetical protein
MKLLWLLLILLALWAAYEGQRPPVDPAPSNGPRYARAGL